MMTQLINNTTIRHFAVTLLCLIIPVLFVACHNTPAIVRPYATKEQSPLQDKSLSHTDMMTTTDRLTTSTTMLTATNAMTSTNPITATGAITSPGSQPDNPPSNFVQPEPTAIPFPIEEEHPSSLSLEPVGGYGNAITAVAIEGSYAYMCEEFNFAVLDISNLVQPVRVFSYPMPGNYGLHSIHIDNELAYTTCGGFVQIFDIRDPTALVPLGIYEETQVLDVQVVDNTAFLHTHRGLTIIDVSDPSNPSFLGSFVPPGERMVGMSIVGTTAFLASANSLNAVDVSNPKKPELLQSLDILQPNYLQNMVVIDDMAYLAGIRNMQVIDVSDPQNLTMHGSYTMKSHETSWFGNELHTGHLFLYSKVIIGSSYTGSSYGLLEIIDVRDPDNPHPVTHYDLRDNELTDIHVSGDILAMVGFYGGLTLFDIHDPTTLTLLSTSHPQLSIERGAVVGDKAYLGTHLNIVDVRTPTAPRLVAKHMNIEGINDIEAVGDLLFLASGRNGLQIAHVNDQGDFFLLHTFDRPNYAVSVAIVDDIAYVADREQGLLVIDVSNLEAPVVLKSFDIQAAQDVLVVGNTLYVAAIGLFTFDINDPSAPSLIGSVNPTPLQERWKRQVFVDGSTAFLTDSSGHLDVFDVRNPADPTFLRAYSVPTPTGYIHIAGSLCFVSIMQDGSHGGLYIFDISDPASLKQIYHNPRFDRYNEFQIVDDLIYMFRLGSFEIFRITGHNMPTSTPVSSASHILPPLPTKTPLPPPTSTLVPPNTPTPVPTATPIPEDKQVTVEFEGQIGGRFTSVVLKDNYAFVIEGNTKLVVLDVQNPQQPVRVSSLQLPDVAGPIVVEGDMAYVLVEGYDPTRKQKLLTIDVSDRSAPVLVGAYESGYGMRALSVISTTAYVALPEVGFESIDVSDPTHPTLIHRQDIMSETHFIQVDGDIAYVSAQDLLIYNVRTPSSPKLLGTFTYPTNTMIREILVNDGIAYLIDDNFGLYLVNVQIPSNPVLLSSYDLGAHAAGAVVSFPYIYIFASSELIILDVSDPTAPVLLDRHQKDYMVNAIGTNQFQERNGIAFIAVDGFLKIVDMRTPSSLHVLSMYGTGDVALVDVQQDKAYVTSQYYLSEQTRFDQVERMSIIDIQDRTNPVLVGSYDVTGTIEGLHVVREYAYILTSTGNQGSNRTKSIEILDVSNPLSPTVQSRYVAEITDFYVVDDRMYVIEINNEANNNTSRLVIFDVSDPQQQVELGSYSGLEDSRAVSIQGTLAYGTSYDHLTILDVSDPTAIVQLARHNICSHIDFQVVEGIAYCLSCHIHLFDLHNPATPRTLGSYGVGTCQKASYWSRAFDIQDNLIFALTNGGQIDVIDKSTPTNLALVGPVYPLPVAGFIEDSDIQVEGNYIYTAVKQGGLRIYRFDQ